MIDVEASGKIQSEFRKSGYAIVRDAVPPRTLDAIAAGISRVFIRRAKSLGVSVPSGSSRADLTAQAVALFQTSPSVYMAAAKLCQHLIGVHRFGVSDEVSSIIEAVGITDPTISTRPVIHFMADCIRIEGGYHKTPAHQDWRSVQGSVDGITMWVPLFDVTENDCPLEIVPGSHKGGLRPSEDDAFGHRVRLDHVDDADFVPVPIRRGGVMVFSGFLVHRTGTVGGNLLRIALSYRFNNAAESAFIRRNYPDRYIYRAQPELLDPEFPAKEDIERVFGTAD